MSGGLLEKAQNVGGDEPTAESSTSESNEATILESSGGLLERAGVTDDAGSPFISASQKKGIAGGIVALLILFIAYQAVMGFSLGGNSISVAGVEMNEADDSLRVQVFIGTSMIGGIPDDDISIDINYGGVTAHTATFQPTAKLSWYEIPFSDFYQGNARGVASDSSDVNYIISVRQGTSSSSDYSADGAIMDRTINDVDGELIALTEPNTNCEQSGESNNCENNGLDHLGAQFRVGVGAIDPVESNSTGVMLHVGSDYTIVANISFEGTTVFTFPTVTVDGSTATWTDGGGLVESAWLDLVGTGVKLDAFGGTQNYIPRSDFYDEDGCYSIDITVTHDSPFGDVFSDSASQGFQFWWDYNETRDSSDANGDGEPDEPYKPTEAC